MRDSAKSLKTLVQTIGYPSLVPYALHLWLGSESLVFGETLQDTDKIAYNTPVKMKLMFGTTTRGIPRSIEPIILTAMVKQLILLSGKKITLNASITTTIEN